MAFDASYQAPQVPGGYVSMQDAQAKALTLRNAVQQAGLQRQLGAQQLQEGAMDLRQKQIDAQDQQTMREAYMQSGGDMAKTQQIMMQRGASPKAISQIQQQMLATQEAHAKLDETTLKNEAAKTQAIGSAAQSVLDMPDEATRTVNWPAVREQMIKLGHASPADVPEQYPGAGRVALPPKRGSHRAAVHREREQRPNREGRGAIGECPRSGRRHSRGEAGHRSPRADRGRDAEAGHGARAAA